MNFARSLRAVLAGDLYALFLKMSPCPQLQRIAVEFSRNFAGMVSWIWGGGGDHAAANPKGRRIDRVYCNAFRLER
jgi:hypothetical protein